MNPELLWHIRCRVQGDTSTRKGETVLMVTHNRAILQRASRSVRLCDGRVAGDERLRWAHRAV